MSVTGSRKKEYYASVPGRGQLGLAAAAAGYICTQSKHKIRERDQFQNYNLQRNYNLQQASESQQDIHFATQVRAIAVVLPIHLKIDFVSHSFRLQSSWSRSHTLFFRRSSVFLRNRTLIWTSCPIAVVLCSSKCYLQTVLDHSLFFHTNPLVLGFRRRVRRADAIHEC